MGQKQSQELTRVNPDRNIFSINCGTNIYFFTLQKFGPSPSPNFKRTKAFSLLSEPMIFGFINSNTSIFLIFRPETMLQAKNNRKQDLDPNLRLLNAQRCLKSLLTVFNKGFTVWDELSYCTKTHRFYPGRKVSERLMYCSG